MKIMQNIFMSMNRESAFGAQQARQVAPSCKNHPPPQQSTAPSHPHPTVPTRSPRLLLPDHLVLLDQRKELCPPGITQLLTLDVKAHGGCTVQSGQGKKEANS